MTRFFVFLISYFFLLTSSAYAACANPAGSEGDLMYNSTYRVMQYCNQANNWIAAGPKGAVSSGDITSNLTGWWKFDESGNVSPAETADSTGNGNTGTLVSFPADETANWIAGQVNNALDFDGTNDHVDIANENTFDRDQTSGQPFTFATWIKRDTSTSIDYIMSKGSNPGYYVHLESGDARVYFDLWGSSNGNLRADSLTIASTGVWYHVAVVKTCGTSYSGCMKIYINGALATSTDNGNEATSSMANASALKIGIDSSNANPFDGKFDDARWYDRALSAADITALYAYTGGCANPTGVEGDLMFNTTYAVPQYCNGTAWIAMGDADTGAASVADYTTNIVSWWKLDDAAGTNANDSGSNNDDGTLTNGPTWGTGKLSGDVVFDGSNDYINVGNNADLYFAGSFSVCGWANRSGALPAFGGLMISDYNAAGDQESFGLGIAGASNLNATNTAFIFQYQPLTGSVPVNLGATTLTSVSTWYHACGTWDGTNRKIYVNGALENTDNGNDTRADVGTNTTIGRAGSCNCDYFPGELDDIRVYNAALTAAQVLQIYQSAAACLNPAGVQGDLMYNNTSNVMQYCAGGNWIKIGGP